MSQKNIIRIAIAAVALLIIGIVVYSLIPRATLLMSVAPEEFTVSIDGRDRQVKMGDEIKVKPGKVTFTLSRDGFDSYTQTITIENGQKVEILQALTAKTEEALDELKTNKSQAIIQRVANAKMQQATEKLTTSNPILDELPINDKFYRINVCESRNNPDDSTKIAICVLLFEPSATEWAKDDVKNRGFNLDDYETYYETPVDESTFEPHNEDGEHVD